VIKKCLIDNAEKKFILNGRYELAQFQNVMQNARQLSEIKGVEFTRNELERILDLIADLKVSLFAFYLIYLIQIVNFD
jgi:hypothetical protein